MGFNAETFEAAEFVPRRKRVPVEALARWFDGEPLWEVRGLNADELHRAIEAPKKQASVEAIVHAITSSGDKAEAVRKAIGLTAGSSGEIVKRLEMLVIGSVAPQIEHATAAKLAESFPIEFFTLTNAITELTGMGFEMGKPAAASPMTPASSPSCELPSSEAAGSTSCGPT
ncbi:MAG TPA: hypothetical protein PKE15_00265 [Ottowia sp.]|nr:hypothetical protein [Ottowia sp.]